MKIRSFIRQHFEKAKQRGYLPMFQNAGTHFEFPVELLLAIASRETNMTNMRGDFRGGKYHGHGIMQVDIGTAPEWCRSGAWKDVNASIQKGTSILADKARQLRKDWPADRPRTLQQFYWVLAASYNHGVPDSLHDFLQDGNPDKDTTGHDYGQDVLGRMQEFAWLLAEHGTTATERVIAAQPVDSGETPVSATGTATVDLPGIFTPTGLETQADGQQAQMAQATAPAVVVQTGDSASVTAGQPAQPVPGGGPNDPKKELETSKPAKSGALKAMLAFIIAPFVAVGIGITDILTAAKAATANNPGVYLVIIAVLVVILAAYWKYQDRQTQLDTQREQHAHERDLANQQVLADNSKVNVVLKT